ncbi:uncharacterized protein C7orf50 homolog [Choloepus didactylus]|uniref:uncharacterized protein C7orf50 homolog n=1 Tax=Choloepus didactylus TaxID=27675 RepID=UPI00189FEFF0|nr:uncharacterized protein C7orf50 homolog [Choloepus didactylus]
MTPAARAHARLPTLRLLFPLVGGWTKQASSNGRGPLAKAGPAFPRRAAWTEAGSAGAALARSMAKQKRKITEVAEKKNKKLKKASVKELLLAPDTTSPRKEVCPEACKDVADPHLLQRRAASREVQETGPGLSPEEQRALERKLKKERKKEEKKRLRDAALCTAQHVPSGAPKPGGAQLALDYLHSWAQKHENWKFQKTRQTWLLLHMYDSDKVPAEQFPTLLAYLEGLQGRARELTVQKAEALMRELDEAGAGSPDTLLAEKTQRVRQVLQLLS